VLGSENESLKVPLKLVAKTATPIVANTQMAIATTGLRMAQADSGPTTLPRSMHPNHADGQTLPCPVSLQG
jgi:hypothetical protein